MKNVVFMGTPEFAAVVLAHLADAGYRVTGVVTQPDRPKGRRKTPVPCPVKEEAQRRGFRVFQPEKLRRNEAAKEEIARMEPDVIVVAAFGQIIPKEILEIPKYGCFNVHASLLPAYRGAAPVQHAILDGRKTTGVTIMRMDEGLDTGDIVSERETEIGKEETSGELLTRLSEIGAKLLLETLPHIFDGSAQYEKQPPESTTPYASMLTKADGRVDWTRDAAQIHRQVRAMNPWPGAWTTLEGKTLRIWRAHEVTETAKIPGTSQNSGSEQVLEKDEPASPGTLVTDGKTLSIVCGRGVLAVDELQLEGKKRMDVKAFLMGYRPKTGIAV